MRENYQKELNNYVTSARRSQGHLKRDFFFAITLGKATITRSPRALVPELAFNYSGYVRFVFAKSIEEIKEGLDRIEKAIKELK